MVAFPGAVLPLPGSTVWARLSSRGWPGPGLHSEHEGGARHLLDEIGEAVSPRGAQARPIDCNDGVFSGMGRLLTTYLNCCSLLMLGYIIACFASKRAFPRGFPGGLLSCVSFPSCGPLVGPTMWRRYFPCPSWALDFYAYLFTWAS